MKTIVSLLALFAATLAGPCAELLDRIAITVGNAVITEQQIYEQLRIAAFLNGEDPQFTQENLRQTADRMVLQLLLSQDMTANGFPAPPAEEAETLLADIRKRHWGSEAEFHAAAQEAGLSDSAISQFLRRMVGTLKYIDFRFKPSVRVSDSELFEPYQQRYGIPGPDEKEPPALEDVREELETELINQSVDEVVDRWLEEAKGRSGVRYRAEVIP